MYDLMNPQRPEADLLVGGQPSVQDLERLAASGLKCVIDLRVPGEHTAFDEPATCARLGVKHSVIAVDGPGDLTIDNARRLVEAVAAAKGPTLAHCGSGNRVGGLFTLHAASALGMGEDDAIAYGKARGLSALEPRLRQMLRR
ncbi:MAG: hypothetical protein ACI8PZ_005956 [Myxococcota bacterium]|jgi:uncharacterized protein (TIGR01244 family)